MNPLVALAQRFTVDWIDRADPAVPPQIMAPGYTIHIGGVDMAGLADYTTATSGQLARFPGLTLTVHDLVTDGDRLALVFTEHGASVRDDLGPAAWLGVALFAWDGERLTENWTQEDYLARRRQLTDGVADAVLPPAVAPWTTEPLAPSPAALETVRSWLAAPDPAGLRVDDGRSDRLVIDVESVETTEIFAAGAQVAFAATWHGPYRGGIADRPHTGAPASLGVAGLVRVVDEHVVDGTLVTDRLGLRKRLPA